MSFLDSIKGLFGPSQKSANPAIFGFFSPSAMPKMGEKEFLQAYKGWVFACTNAISQRISEIEMTLEKKVKDVWKPVDTHPALDTLHNVNDFMSYSDLMFGTQAYQELTGNQFWYLVKNGAGDISEIWPLDPTRTTVVKSNSAFIAGYVFMSEAGKKVPFQVEEIVHFKTFNPRNPYRGMGTVEAAALAIDTDNYAGEWHRNFFGNAAQPSGILSTDGTLSQEQYDRIKTNWDARYRGVQNAHKMALLEGGLKWTPITPTSKEMQFTDSRKDLRDEILAIFGVPKIIVGITEDVNYASAAASEYIFNKNVIKPKMKALVGKLNEFYLPRWGLDPKQYRFNFVDPVPENLDQKRADRESGIRNYYMTPNEAREQIGLEPVLGGDQLYIPAGYVPMSSVIEPEPQDPQDPPKDDPSAQQSDAGKDDAQDNKDDTKPTKGIKRVYKTGTPAKGAKYINAQTKVMRKAYLKLNKKLEEKILDRLATKSATVEIMKEYLLHKENSLINFVFEGYNDWVALVLDATTEGLQRIFEKSGKDGLAEVDIDIDFDLANPRAVKWIESRALDTSDSYTDEMKGDIISVLQTGIDEGSSVQTIAQSISQFFDDTNDWRATRIARTETITAYAHGNLEGYKQSGVVAGKKWLPDAEACEICVTNADAGTIGLDEAFPSGDDAPTAHPHCECSLQPVVKSDTDEE